jgi:hypothetical protein
MEGLFMRLRMAFWLLLAFAGLSSPQAGTLTSEQESWLAQASRRDQHGWIHLRVGGSPQVRGFQHGYLLASEFADSRRSRQRLWEYETATDWPWLVAESARLFRGKIDDELIAEIDGLVAGFQARGVTTSRDELVTLNAYFDLAWYWWPTVKGQHGSAASAEVKESCSAFIATGSMTRDGGIVMGHNTMFDFAQADFNVVLDLTPAQGHRLVMQAAPGLVHSGTDFFLNAAGLMGCETTLGDFRGFDPAGVPEFVRMRLATQYGDSIDAWCDRMRQGNNGGYANAWLLGDYRTGEIARLELGLKHQRLERTRDGCFVGSNVAEDLKILRFETERAETNIKFSSVARRVRWHELMQRHRGRIDLPLAQRFEADHYDTYLRRNRPGARSLCGHFELDDQRFGTGQPFDPSGTFDAKVVDSALARDLQFRARWGSACGRAFDAARFLRQHPQYAWQADLLKSRPARPWTLVSGSN